MRSCGCPAPIRSPIARGCRKSKGVPSTASSAPVGMERFPTKIIVDGTSYSTLAGSGGAFEFRNLPSGRYKLIALRAGNGPATTEVDVREGQTNQCRLVLSDQSSNLIRNGDFAIRWKEKFAPDCWDFWQGTWNGEIIPLKSGQKYRLTAKFKPDADAEVVLRWTRHLPHALPRTATAPMFQTRKLTPDESTHEFTASENFGLLQLSLKTSGKRPQELFENVELRPLAKD